MKTVNLTRSVLLLAFLLGSSHPLVAQSQSPLEALEQWVEMWATHDLNAVDDLFRRDETITYFSSSFEGVIVGYDAVVEHHRRLGFVAGGADSPAQLWVENETVTLSARSANVAAIWYFGDPDDDEPDQHGPMSMMVSKEKSGWKIVHMHFGNYPRE